MSSGAAVNESPLSGGYAGAKAAVRFIASYAAIESDRAGPGISFVSVLPRLTPATDLGAKAAAAYAERQGVDFDTFAQSSGPVLSAEQVGRSVLEVAIGDPRNHGAYLLHPQACRHWPEATETPKEKIAMNTPPVVLAQEWEAARQRLLVKEKEVMRAHDALA
ncbi:MAG TPA: hypothetical protein VED43_00685, partial [Mycobacterium sp.]|nr:hypothetical protein [Mycobacterium sp.]